MLILYYSSKNNIDNFASSVSTIIVLMELIEEVTVKKLETPDINMLNIAESELRSVLFHVEAVKEMGSLIITTGEYATDNDRPLIYYVFLEAEMLYSFQYSLLEYALYQDEEDEISVPICPVRHVAFWRVLLLVYYGLEIADRVDEDSSLVSYWRTEEGAESFFEEVRDYLFYITNKDLYPVYEDIMANPDTNDFLVCYSYKKSIDDLYGKYGKLTPRHDVVIKPKAPDPFQSTVMTL